jgi:predicted acyl esterase
LFLLRPIRRHTRPVSIRVCFHSSLTRRGGLRLLIVISSPPLMRDSVALPENARLNSTKRKFLVLFALLAGTALLAFSASHLRQQSAASVSSSELFNKTDAMIPARDGVKLHTEIYAPKNARGSLPLFLTRTPYGLKDDEDGFSRMLALYSDMFADGYIFVFQDIRGRYASEGKFVMQRAPRDRKDPHSIDEATDTYDTIDWLLKNVPGNNGRVGQAGISYDGWLTAVTLIEPHPALKAVSEQASPADMFLGDDFHHNGAFRLSYGFEYTAELETGKTNFQFQFDKYDTFEWYLLLGPLSNANKLYFHGALPTWNDFVAHPNYDAYWKNWHSLRISRISL